MKPHILLFALVAACSQEKQPADPPAEVGAQVHYFSLGRN